MFVDDMADASIFVLNLSKELYKNSTRPMLSHINIGTGQEVSISELAETIKEVVGFNGHLEFDVNKPDGISRKLLNSNLIKSLGWSYQTCLKEGLSNTYELFKKNQNLIRK